MSAAATRRRTPRTARAPSAARAPARRRSFDADDKPARRRSFDADDKPAPPRGPSKAARKKKATKGHRAAKAQERNAAKAVAQGALRQAELSGKQRSYLRALAHHLKPIIQLGHQGLTPEVIEETGRALLKHELLKLKLGRECPEDKSTLPARLEAATGARVAQVIGQTFLLYRARPTQPSIVLPISKKRARTGKNVMARKAAPSADSGQDDALEEF